MNLADMPTKSMLHHRPKPAAHVSDHPVIMGDIYAPECNLTVWQRSLDDSIERYVSRLCAQQSSLNIRTVIQCDEDLEKNASELLQAQLPAGDGQASIVADIVELLQMYECLLGPSHIGLRMTMLKAAMCPKFHVDRLPVRLVTCYSGTGTQYLPEPEGDTARIPANEPERVLQLTAGDVALLKGDGWHGNEGYGIVHRSPPVSDHQARLFLSLDYME